MNVFEKLVTNGFEPGMAVQSVSGHDAGRKYIIVVVEQRYLWLIDGIKRKVANPKRKHSNHVRLIDMGLYSDFNESQKVDLDLKCSECLKQLRAKSQIVAKEEEI